MIYRKAGTALTILLIGFLLVALTATTTACKGKKENANSGPAVPAKPLSVEAMIVRPQSLIADIEVPGTIIANETTEIHPEVSGRLTHLNIQEGRNIGKGTLIAKIFDGDLQARKRKIEVQLKIAEQTENRQSQLLKIQGISQQDYDLSLLQVQNLKADLDIIQEDIRKTEIRAPFSGKLGLKKVSPGAYVNPTTVLTTISQVEQLKIQFNIPERYSNQLKNGTPVTFMIDGAVKTYTATVLASEVQIEENTRSLAVRALIKNKDAALVPGAFAKVRVSFGEDEEALLVSNNIIIPSGRKKQLYIYRSGKAAQTEVITGVRDSTNVQIVEGLKPGDTVITSAILFLRPGMDVELAKIK